MHALNFVAPINFLKLALPIVSDELESSSANAIEFDGLWSSASCYVVP